MYYYACIQNLKNGTNPMSIIAKETSDDAREQMNYDMYYALNQKENYHSILCLVINELGNVERLDRWEEPIIYYTVTFDSDGGNPTPDSEIVVKNSTIIPPNDPVKEGYNFVGWTLNGELYNFSTPVTSNINLIASWGQINQ